MYDVRRMAVYLVLALAGVFLSLADVQAANVVLGLPEPTGLPVVGIMP